LRPGPTEYEAGQNLNKPTLLLTRTSAGHDPESVQNDITIWGPFRYYLFYNLIPLVTIFKVVPLSTVLEEFLASQSALNNS
jgi:hypothetical protein